MGFLFLMLVNVCLQANGEQCPGSAHCGNHGRVWALCDFDLLKEDAGNIGITKSLLHKVSVDLHGEPHHSPLCPGLFLTRVPS